MKTFIYNLTLLLLISCGQKNSKSTPESTQMEKNTIIVSPNSTESKVELEKYVVDGMFLKGTVRLFDSDMKSVGKLEIAEITPTQISEKSTKMFNIEGSTDNCKKAYFVKVKYQNKDYIVFGQDVYEINNKQKFSTPNEKKEKLTLFPITNFEMGASDEEGLTGCDDYSLLVLLNEKKNSCSLMKYPDNEDIHGESAYKYAALFHDDGSEEKIYKVFVRQDTLVIGIKATYQEGGSVFNLKAKLSSELPETKIADRIRYETDEELKKMDEIK